MFGSKSTSTAAPTIVLTTTSQVPGVEAYTVLGLVHATERALLGGTKLDGCLDEVRAQAQKLGARAVVGIQVATTVTSGSHVNTTILGTAITWE